MIPVTANGFVRSSSSSGSYQSFQVIAMTWPRTIDDSAMRRNWEVGYNIQKADSNACTAFWGRLSWRTQLKIPPASPRLSNHLIRHPETGFPGTYATSSTWSRRRLHVTGRRLKRRRPDPAGPCRGPRWQQSVKVWWDSTSIRPFRQANIASVEETTRFHYVRLRRLNEQVVDFTMHCIGNGSRCTDAQRQPFPISCDTGKIILFELAKITRAAIRVRVASLGTTRRARCWQRKATW